MKKKIAVLFLVFSMVFISCDQDFNTIGADLVGDEHFDFDKYEVQGLKAYSVPTGEVETDNLAINPLGFYNNPFFGQTKANFVSQLTMATEGPKLGTSAQVENVTLYVPYFSTVDATNADGSREYSLDSIYSKNEADKISKMKLSVYENGYYLSSFGGANQDEAARYYSDMDGLIDAQKRGYDNITTGNSVLNGIRLNDSPNTAENDQFFFNKAEIVIYKTKFNTISGELEYVDANDVVTTDPTKYVVKERLAPGIYLTLNKAFFKKKILESASSNLFNNNAFRQYFKGLYFKMEQVAGQEGAMAMLNFNNAKLNVNINSINEGATAATSKTFVMNLGSNASANTVSLQDFTYSGAYNTGLSASNQTTGTDANLFVKGGKGSVVYMDVFGDADVLGDNGQPYINPDTGQPGNKIPDELDLLRLKGWLINDAYLEFYIDRNIMAVNSKYQEAERLYLFDATNQKPLVDYIYDTSTSLNPKYNRYIYGGMIQRDTDPTSKKGTKYKIRITQHINNLLNSTNINVNKNVKLGLCVTENIAISKNYYYKTPVAFAIGPNIEYFPTASIMAQQGTVLYGTHPVGLSPEDTEKYKLKLTIHFTKPN